MALFRLNFGAELCGFEWVDTSPGRIAGGMAGSGGISDLKRGGLSALAGALTCAGMFAAIHCAAAQTATTQDGTATLRVAAVDATEKTGKKAASHKSRDRKSRETKTREKRSHSH